jgi:hypothetical protein
VLNNTLLEQLFSNLVLEDEALQFRTTKSSFSRNRKLPLKSLIALILQLSNKGSGDSVASNLTDFLESIGSETTIDRAAITRSRNKLSYKYFDFLFKKIIKTITNYEKNEPQYQWHNFNLIGIDGSKVALPATAEIREYFDPKSGLKQNCGHYPQCLVSTAYDILRDAPVARTVAPINGSEREESLKMIETFPPNSLLLFDRGYLSFELLDTFRNQFSGELLLRCPGSSTFNVIKNFLNSDKDDDIVTIEPTKRYKDKYKGRSVKPITVRIIRMKSEGHEDSPIITTLMDKEEFPAVKLAKLYWKRWASETGYRHEKSSGKMEDWHSKTVNGVLQELFAFPIMHALSSVMVRSSRKTRKNRMAKPVTKEVLKQTKKIISLVVNYKKTLLYKRIEKLFKAINSYLYYPPKLKRKPNPRVSKQPINKFKKYKMKRIRNA